MVRWVEEAGGGMWDWGRGGLVTLIWTTGLNWELGVGVQTGRTAREMEGHGMKRESRKSTAERQRDICRHCVGVKNDSERIKGSG